MTSMQSISPWLCKQCGQVRIADSSTCSAKQKPHKELYSSKLYELSEMLEKGFSNVAVFEPSRLM